MSTSIDRTSYRCLDHPQVRPRIGLRSRRTPRGSIPVLTTQSPIRSPGLRSVECRCWKRRRHPSKKGRVLVLPASRTIRFHFEKTDGPGEVRSTVASSQPVRVPAAARRATASFRVRLWRNCAAGEVPRHAEVSFGLGGSNVFGVEVGPLTVAELREGRTLQLSVDLANVEQWTVELHASARFQACAGICSRCHRRRDRVRGPAMRAGVCPPATRACIRCQGEESSMVSRIGLIQVLVVSLNLCSRPGA